MLTGNPPKPTRAIVRSTHKELATGWVYGWGSGMWSAVGAQGPVGVDLWVRGSRQLWAGFLMESTRQLGSVSLSCPLRVFYLLCPPPLLSLQIIELLTEYSRWGERYMSPLQVSCTAGEARCHLHTLPFTCGIKSRTKEDLPRP